MVEWGWDDQRFVHIPNFVDATSYQPDYTAGKAFLYFGRLSPEKGLTTLIKAAARVKVAVSMAGDGPQLDELRELAQEEGADVTFLGHLSGQNLHSAVRAARATVLPSEWYENAPISMLESYALGKPGYRCGDRWYSGVNSGRFRRSYLYQQIRRRTCRYTASLRGHAGRQCGGNGPLCATVSRTRVLGGALR